MKPYKYYAGLTSQVGFCATPLRLDSYNRCQFSCEYCFASTRQGYGRNERLKIGNPASLQNRLSRVFEGRVSSALDELISHRVPFQLGGMSDPFSKLESVKRVTLEYLKILKEYDYPVIVSTKSAKIVDREYLDIIAESNIYVRFSTTIVDPKLQTKIDKGCPPLEEIAVAAKELHRQGIPVCFRFQPIIPGYEHHFKYYLSVAYESNVKHISAEFLKCPIDANIKFGKSLKGILNGNPIQRYKDLGALKQGREYILPITYRAPVLAAMAKEARGKGMTFGFADNDLLLHSDGNACCAASNLYLRDSNYFTANIVSLAKERSIGERLCFSDFLSGWVPTRAISTYLNSKARIAVSDSTKPEWLSYLKEMWVGKLGVFSPDYFDGIEMTSELDEHGLPVFIKSHSKIVELVNLGCTINHPHNKKVQPDYACA